MTLKVPLLASQISDVLVGMFNKDYLHETSEITNKTIDSITNKIGADHIHLKVKATENLPKGSLVTMIGYNIGEDAIEVAIPTSYTDLIAGITHYGIDNGDFGGIQLLGVYEDLDTSIYSIGDKLYSDGAGGFSTIKPNIEEYQILAYVIKTHSSKGSIFISATNIPYTNIFIPPTNIPSVSGAIWNDNGTLKLS